MSPNHLILCQPLSAFSLSQHQGLFHWANSSHQVAIVLELHCQSFQWIFLEGLISFRIDWFDLAVQGTLKSLLQHHSSEIVYAAAAAAKSLQSCPTLCDPMDCSPPGSPVPGILQARTLEWGAIAYSFAGHLQCFKCICVNILRSRGFLSPENSEFPLFLQKLKRTAFDPVTHYRAYIWRKPWFERIHAPQHSF